MGLVFAFLAIGGGFAVPIVFQPDTDNQAGSSMACDNDIPVFRHRRIQFFVQSYFHIPILSDAGGGIVSRTDC